MATMKHTAYAEFLAYREIERRDRMGFDTKAEHVHLTIDERTRRFYEHRPNGWYFFNLLDEGAIVRVGRGTYRPANSERTGAAVTE